MDLDHLELTAPAYVRAKLSVRSNRDPHEAPLRQLAELVEEVVRFEGPIHIDEVARRIASAFGKSRTGTRIVEATTRAAHYAMQKDKTLTVSGAFLHTVDQAKDPPVRNRSAESGSLLKADYLPPMEIGAAARRVRSESGQIRPEDLTKAIARLLGFQRVGGDLASAINNAIADVPEAE